MIDLAADTDGTGRETAATSPWLWTGFAFILAVFTALMVWRTGQDWQYRNEDNGAWFSAVAHAHQRAGLQRTRGQDFFLVRQTRDLKPYLHHPPFVGLWLAAAFAITGHDGPAVARGAVIILHTGSCLLMAALAARLLGGIGVAWLCSVLVFFLTPMSVFYGSIPNHEAPGLFFFLVGAYAYIRYREPGGRRSVWMTVGMFGWFMAAFSSWHSAFCVAGFLVMPLALDRSKGARLFGIASAATLAMGLAFVVVHLRWANDWAPTPSQGESMGHWLILSALSHPGSVATDFTGSFVRCFRFFGFVPWLLFLAFPFACRGRQALTDSSSSGVATWITALCTGSLTYWLLFAKAVAVHPYQLFYLLPSVALATGLVVRTMVDRISSRNGRPLTTAVACVAAATFILSVGYTIQLGSDPYGYAVKATADIRAQYF